MDRGISKALISAIMLMGSSWAAAWDNGHCESKGHPNYKGVAVNPALVACLYEEKQVLPVPFNKALTSIMNTPGSSWGDGRFIVEREGVYQVEVEGDIQQLRGGVVAKLKAKGDKETVIYYTSQYEMYQPEGLGSEEYGKVEGDRFVASTISQLSTLIQQ